MHFLNLSTKQENYSGTSKIENFQKIIFIVYKINICCGAGEPGTAGDLDPT